MCPSTIQPQCPNALTSECLEDAVLSATSTLRADAASRRRCCLDWMLRDSHCTPNYIQFNQKLKSNMKNEMNKIPTPVTDASEFPVMTFPSRDNPLVVRSIIVRDLERCLTVAREALMAIADKSVNLEHAERIADRALRLTARNPKP